MLQCIRSGQDSGISARRSTRHGAACIHHMAVERHDPEAVAESPGHFYSVIQILRNYRLTQKIIKNVPIGRIKLNEFRCNTDKSTAFRHPRLFQHAAANGRNG